MTQAADDAFAVAAHIPGGTEYAARWAKAAAAFRVGRAMTADLSYGPTPRQVMDIFYPDRLPRGTVVFVHGGFWRLFDKSSWSHLAAGALAQGWAVAMPSYDLCPDIPIAGITAQIARAVDLVAARVPGPLRLCGHSAGGHLVARMLDPALGRDWQGRVERVLPISPLSDLVPLLETAMNADFKLDRAAAEAESPVRQPVPAQPVTVWVGADERPAFLAQAQGLAAAWHCDLVTEPGRHHFDVIAGLEEPQSPVMRALLA